MHFCQKAGDIAVVKVIPDKPLVIEKVSEFPQLGRFAIRDMGMTVAAGQCIDLEKATVVLVCLELSMGKVYCNSSFSFFLKPVHDPCKLECCLKKES